MLYFLIQEEELKKMNNHLVIITNVIKTRNFFSLNIIIFPMILRLKIRVC